MSRPQRRDPSTPRSLVAAGLLLAALFALVALASRSGLVTGTERSSSPPLGSELIGYLYVLVLVVGVAAVPLFLYVNAVETKRSPRGRRRRRLAPLTFVALAGLVFLVVTQLHDRIGELLGMIGVIDPETLDSGEGSSFEPPTLEWAQVAAVSSVAFAATGIMLARRKLGRGRVRDPVAEQLAAVLGGSLDDLYAETDPRRAVIRAYARMEREVGSCGVPRHESEAPLEYLARVLDELDVPAEPARKLTDLFERARFSRHTIDAAMRDDAVAALESVRRHLQELG